MTVWDRLKTAVFGRDAPSPQELFLRDFMAEALEYPGVERVEKSTEHEFTVLVWPIGASDPIRVYLGNVFHETRELSPEERRERIRALLTFMEKHDAEPSWEEARRVLVPLVRMIGLERFTSTKLVSRPFVPFIGLFVGLDQDETVAYVSAEHAARWNVNDATIFAAAQATLTSHMLESDVEPYDPDAPYPIWHVTRDDSYESSRLAVPGFLASFRGKVSGNPIAIIPDRSTLIISGDGDARAIERLATHAEREFMGAARPLSPAIYTVGASGEVEPLHLPRDHAHHFLVERGHRLLAATCYAEQKKHLDAKHEQEGIDVFVATLGVFMNKDSGETQSWATMVKGVDTLLPEADLIALMEDEDGWNGMVPWQKVFELAPACFEKEPSLEPSRWRVVGWPDERAMASLRAAAVR